MDNIELKPPEHCGKCDCLIGFSLDPYHFRCNALNKNLTDTELYEIIGSNTHTRMEGCPLEHPIKIEFEEKCKTNTEKIIEKLTKQKIEDLEYELNKITKTTKLLNNKCCCDTTEPYYSRDCYWYSEEKDFHATIQSCYRKGFGKPFFCKDCKYFISDAKVSDLVRKYQSKGEI